MGETYHQQFAEDSILNLNVDEMRMEKLLTKNDMSCLKRLIVKFRLHLKEGHESIEQNGKGDILLDHAIFINDLMIKRTEALQAAAKHEKDKNKRSEHFMVTVSLFKKGLIAFEKQQVPLRRHLARMAFAKTEEGAAYFKQKAREEMAAIIKERVEEYRRIEAEKEAQPKEIPVKDAPKKLEKVVEEDQKDLESEEENKEIIKEEKGEIKEEQPISS
ncbi:unnamed protein product [Caenorhabditis nigoni]